MQQRKQWVKSKQVLHMLSSNQNYHINEQQYRKQVQLGNAQTIVEVIIIIEELLRDDQYNPYSKLLALRFIKDTFVYASYGMITLINSVLTDVLMQIALFKKSNQDEDRGQELFLSYSRAAYTQLYLRTVGLSAHKIVQEMYQATANIIATCPFNSAYPSIASNLNKQYGLMRQMNVKFPNSRTYYKDKQTDKIVSAYHRKLSSPSLYLPQIEKLYEYLIKHKLAVAQQNKLSKRILLMIIRSGDQYVVDKLINWAKLNLHKDHQTVIDMLNSMIKTGDIESIYKIQTQLLLPITTIINEHRLSELQLRTVEMWGTLIKSQNLHNDQAYQLISAALSNHTKNMKNNLPQQLLKFQQNYNNLKENNAAKFKVISKAQPNLKQIQSLLTKLQDKNINNSGEQNTISLAQEQFHFEDSVASSKKIYRVSKSQHNFNKYPMTPKSQANYKVQNNAQQNNIRVSANSNDKNRVFTQRVKQPKILKGRRKNSGNQDNMSQKASSVDRFQTPVKNSVDETPKPKLSLHNEYYTINLEQQIKRSKQKQRQLQLQLKLKDELIDKLSKNEQSQLSHKKSQNNIQKFSSQSSASKIKSQYSDYKTVLKPNLNEGLHQNQLQITSQHINSYKDKKQILKNKSLLLKNANLQIGMITRASKDIIECSIFCTPFLNLNEFTLKINCPPWLNIYDKTQQQYKCKTTAETQFVNKFRLACNFNKDLGCYYQKPALQISYLKQKQLINHKVYLPILINKFGQNLVHKQDEVKRISLKNGELSQYFHLNIKVCRKFQDFLKYFPHAFMLDDKVYAAQLCVLGRIKFMLSLKMVSKTQVILKIIPYEKLQQNKKILQIIFKVYCIIFKND